MSAARIPVLSFPLVQWNSTGPSLSKSNWMMCFNDASKWGLSVNL